MRPLVVCAVARAVATRTGYHAYTRARTDDKHYPRRNSYPRFTIPLPLWYPTVTMTQQEPLNKTPRNLSILTARYYHIQPTTSRSRLITL